MLIILSPDIGLYGLNWTENEQNDLYPGHKTRYETQTKYDVYKRRITGGCSQSGVTVLRNHCEGAMNKKVSNIRTKIQPLIFHITYPSRY